MMPLYDLPVMFSQFDQRSDVELVLLALFYLAHIQVGLFCLRTVYVFVARLFGLYTPSYYNRWPSVLPGWRYIHRGWMSVQKWHERVFRLSKMGNTGGFASPLAMLCLKFKPGMVHLGRAQAWGLGLLQPIGLEIKRHLFMLAMTGTGKTTALTTMISEWKGSVFLIDPKADVVKALAARDPRKWFIFDLSNLSGTASISINFMDCIKEAIQREGMSAGVLWAMRIAEALIVTPSGNRSPFFYTSSRRFFAGLILHVISTYPEEDHHLPKVRDLLVHGERVFDDDGTEMTVGDEAQELLIREMLKNTAFDGVIASAASVLASASGETLGSVRATLLDETKLLDLPDVRAKLMHNDLSLSELKTRDDIVLAFTASIYSIREELSRLSRLLTNMIAYTFEAVPDKKGQCLAVIDELPSQGHNPVLEVILAVGRSMGLVLLGVSQNIELMRNVYPKSFKSFIGESDATFWMGGNHPENAQMLSSMLGRKTLVEKDKHTGRKNHREVAVMEPEQVTRVLDPNSDQLIVTRAGGRALTLKNEPHFKALPVWRYAHNPDHKEALLRHLSRLLFDRSPNSEATK